MHFHLPKPLHGWREFAGEVGIIVIGVLVALGAEQVVEGFHWRHEVGEFRSAVRNELSANLASLKYRVDQSGCVKRKLAEVQRLRDSGRAGASVHLLSEMARPSVISFRRSVWDSRSGDLTAHMPMNERLGYSELYDEFDNVAQQIRDEKEAWRSLAAYNGATHLSDQDVKRLTELIYRAKSLDWVIGVDWTEIIGEARELGLAPAFGAHGRFIPPPDPAFCRPLLAAGGA
jgi:hypothetical protein